MSLHQIIESMGKEKLQSAILTLHKYALLTEAKIITAYEKSIGFALRNEAFASGCDYAHGSWESSDPYCIHEVEDRDNSSPNFEAWLKGISLTKEFENLVEK